MANVEVVYIPAGEHALQVVISFVDGMTVAGALERSGFLEQNPALVDGPVGIFSKVVSRDTLVQPGDRVELYRPLQLNPMETRRQRAKKSKK